jgi:hypothetical protein
VSAQFSIGADQGATLSLAFLWLQADGQTPVNVTGFTAAMQVRTQSGGSLLADLGSHLALGGAGGTITLSVPASTTGAWTWDGGVYDMQLTDGSGNVITLLAGQFTITPAVTT